MNPANGRAGVVYLVGAGPGAADLITVRGFRVLKAADVVLYDALVTPALVAEARPGAELISVGKRGHCEGATRQEAIHDVLVRMARAGKIVCRLKGGDPSVFGRGGEEAEALAEAGVPFEVVPGVTAAVGACAAAGFSLTHRGVGSAVALVAGHQAPGSPGDPLDWAALARLPGIAFYMAARHISGIAQSLIAHGLPPHTPAAVISSGTLPDQRVVTAPLARIGEEAAFADIAAPAVIVVGEIVRRRVLSPEAAGESIGSNGSRSRPALLRFLGHSIIPPDDHPFG